MSASTGISQCWPISRSRLADELRSRRFPASHADHASSNVSLLCNSRPRLRRRRTSSTDGNSPLYADFSKIRSPMRACVFSSSRPSPTSSQTCFAASSALVFVANPKRRSSRCPLLVGIRGVIANRSVMALGELRAVGPNCWPVSIAAAPLERGPLVAHCPALSPARLAARSCMLRACRAAGTDGW